MNKKDPDRLAKSERMHYIVSRMRVQQDITPAVLAEELHVSERTVYRDMRSLERGQALKKRYSRREGRYVLETEPTLPPMVLTPSEALALYTAASNPALAKDNFFSTDLRAALSKISQTLAPDAAKEVSALEGRINVAPLALVTDNLQRPLMEKIRRAMRTNRRVRIYYWSASSDTERSLTVAPYDLRLMRHSWYLMALSQEHGEVRTFKVSRIRAAEILPERFRFPRRFSAETYFAKAWEMFGGSDEEITVEVRFAPRVARIVEDSRGARFASMEILPDNSLLCKAVVNSLKEIAWWILSYGSAAEVISPPELRTVFAQTAREMAALYASVPAEA